MKRIVKLSGKYYGYDLKDINEDDLYKDICDFLDQNDPVILVSEYEDAEKFDIYENEINIIERED